MELMNQIEERIQELQKKPTDINIAIVAELTLVNKKLKSISVTRCCESDSKQLVLFADWLQYNGKYSLPEQQVKDFLKD
tara:strand:+ start:54 stop:290 length:237 start_codon:yes stop_codon:yes gene_type:complete